MCFVFLFNLSRLTPYSAAVIWGRIGLCLPIIQLLRLVIENEPDTPVTNGCLFYCIL